MKPGLLLLIAVILLSFSFVVYGQEDNKEEEEGCRLSREENMAEVASMELMNEEDFAGARKPLLDHLATGPECITETFYLMLSQAWYFDETTEEAKRVKEAIKVIEKGYAVYPESEKIVLLYAGFLSEAEDFAKAAPLWEKTYDIVMKKDLKYLKNAAGCYYQSQKLEDAKRVYKRLIKLSEKPDKDFYNAIILISQEQGRMEEAEGYVMEALDIFPTETQYWKLLGNFRLDKEDYTGAGAALEIDSDIEPPETLKKGKFLVDMYRALNVPLRVAREMNRLLKNEKNPKDEDYIMIASAYAQAMKTDEAVAYLDKILAKEHSTKLMMNKAQILYQARRYKQAIIAYDEVIDADPKIGEAYFWKGWSAVELKDWLTAKEAFRNALEDKKFREGAKNAIDVLENLDEARKD